MEATVVVAVDRMASREADEPTPDVPAGAAQASVVALDATTGDELWQMPLTDAPEVAAISIGPDGLILAANDLDDACVSTPLEIVRRAYREPTAVLAAAGVAPVERDEFAERAWPDDTYGLVVHGLGDLGDEDLAPLQMAWGLAKAKVLRARRDA